MGSSRRAGAGAGAGARTGGWTRTGGEQPVVGEEEQSGPAAQALLIRLQSNKIMIVLCNEFRLIGAPGVGISET